MRLAHKIGLGLSSVHSIVVLVVFFLPYLEELEVIIAMTIYAPLIPLDLLGLPVFSGPKNWGFSNPSGIGIALAIGLWISLWFLVGRIIEAIFSIKKVSK